MLIIVGKRPSIQCVASHWALLFGSTKVDKPKTQYQPTEPQYNFGQYFSTTFSCKFIKLELNFVLMAGQF